MTKLISIIVPVYNEEELINSTINRLQSEVNDWSYNHEIIYVNDGSKDSTLAILKKAAEKDTKIKIIDFSKNYGHQMAFTAGLDYAVGDAVIVIDGDLQDPPHVMNQFIDKWEEGYDVVYGKRLKRKGESFFKLITAKIFYKIIDFLSDTKIPQDVGDFRLMDRKVVDEFKLMRERHRFIRGMVSWMGFKQCAVNYDRDKRMAGETKYPINKMIKFAMDGIFSFSIVPIKASMWLGIFTIILSFIGIIYSLISRIFTDNWVTGWTAIIISTLFIGGIQLFSIGILGNYVGRTFEEIKGRPLYIVDELTNFE